MKKTIFTLIISICLIGCSKQIDETISPVVDSKDLQLNQNAEELGNLVVPMLKEPLQLSDSELAYFNDLKDAPIIGLGEATHGTKEFFQMKHRLFKYFVEKFNHRIFAFEMDFSEALIFDEYVQTGKGDIVQLMKSKMIFWTWTTSEVKELLVWMKDYNIGKASRDRVHIYGMDCQYMSYHIPELSKRLQNIDAKLKTEIDNLLSNKTLGEHIKSSDNVFLKINDLIKTNKSNLIAKSSTEEYKFIEQISNIMVQTYFLSNEKNDPNTMRDRFMAENTVWLKSLSDFPISVWAHNEHVKNTQLGSGGGRAMGFYINNIIQGGYKNIGFTFSYGTTTNYDGDAKKFVVMDINLSDVRGYANEVFSRVKTPNYFFKFSDVYRKKNLQAYFSNAPFLWTGGGFYQKDPFYKLFGNFPPISEGTFDYTINISKMTHSDCYWLP